METAIIIIQNRKALIIELKHSASAFCIKKWYRKKKHFNINKWNEGNAKCVKQFWSTLSHNRLFNVGLCSDEEAFENLTVIPTWNRSGSYHQHWLSLTIYFRNVVKHAVAHFKALFEGSMSSRRRRQQHNFPCTFLTFPPVAFITSSRI